MSLQLKTATKSFRIFILLSLTMTILFQSLENFNKIYKVVWSILLIITFNLPKKKFLSLYHRSLEALSENLVLLKNLSRNLLLLLIKNPLFNHIVQRIIFLQRLHQENFHQKIFKQHPHQSLFHFTWLHKDGI